MAKKPLRKIVAKDSSKKDSLRSKTPWEFKEKPVVAKKDVPTNHEANFKATMVSVYDRAAHNQGYPPEASSADGSYGAAGEVTEGHSRKALDQAMDHEQKIVMHNELNTKTCVSSCMNHGYTIQLQIHKILEME